jgi:WD40-like Beta Propeller Repeat
VVAATAVVAAAITAAGVWRINRTGASATSDRLSLTGRARLTHDVGFSDSPVWSPDGKVFAYSANKSGNFEIYVRPAEGGEEVNVTRILPMMSNPRSRRMAPKSRLSRRALRRNASSREGHLLGVSNFGPTAEIFG